MSSLGFGDSPRQPRYIIEWEEFSNGMERTGYRGTLIYLPTGVEGEDEEKLGSETSLLKHSIEEYLKKVQLNHWRNQSTAHYRKDFPLG